ncbi:hypothetical protein HFO56_23150 [Rhizobium laguerreae]|uniref:hypothetical protein n=1 Tax=Rhizobium laguerreae TaxID=1076926 RepID=UPI001C915C27|nr:hypothetical protein [Rhizobium laguerreae]MBY3155223.1 hypothetical protein [Rhizobium laguerreae]
MADGKQGNGEATLDLNGIFAIGDIVMMIDLLQYGAVRSMMGEGKDASERMVQLREQLVALSPLPKSGDRSSIGHEWFRACKAASKCSYYGAYMVERENSRNNEYHMDIVCDAEVQRVVSNGKRGEIEAALPAIRQCLRDLAPIGAEPVVLLKGLVDLGERVAIRHMESIGWQNEGRLDAVQVAMRERLSPATPFVHVVNASNFWGVNSVIEARFAVPVSVAEEVIAHVAELNSDALAEYSKKYRAESFAVAPSV